MMNAGGIELQILSATDPAAQAQMLRHIAAVRILITGRRHDDDDIGVTFAAVFGVSEAAEAAITHLTGADGLARAVVAFDVDDPQGPPAGFGLFLKEDDGVTFHHRCNIWSPPGAGRAVFVSSLGGRRHHFAYRRGSLVRRTDGPQPHELASGFQRARRRLERLVASEELRVVGSGAHLLSISGS